MPQCGSRYGTIVADLLLNQIICIQAKFENLFDYDRSGGRA